MFTQEIFEAVVAQRYIDFEFIYSSKVGKWEVKLQNNTAFQAANLALAIDAACKYIVSIPTENKNLPDGVNQEQARHLAILNNNLPQYITVLDQTTNDALKHVVRRQLLFDLFNYNADTQFFTALFKSKPYSGSMANFPEQPWELVFNAVSISKEKKDEILTSMLPYYVSKSGICKLKHAQILDCAKLDYRRLITSFIQQKTIDLCNPAQSNNTILHAATVYTECAKAGATTSCEILKNKFPKLDYVTCNNKAAQGALDKLTLEGLDYLVSEGVSVLDIVKKKALINNSVKQQKQLQLVTLHLKPLQDNITTITSELSLG